MRRVRKAITAGIGAAITAGVTSIVQDGALTRAEVTKALGVALAAGVTVAWATWRVRNDPTTARRV
jgi:hypothetical protein